MISRSNPYAPAPTLRAPEEPLQRLHDVARSLHLSTFDAARKVFVPAAAAAVLVGCRLSLGLALVMAVIAEMVGNPEGLGYAVIREQQAMQPSFMFAYPMVAFGLPAGLHLSINRKLKPDGERNDD